MDEPQAGSGNVPAERKPGGIANLTPFKPGQCPNPTGKNGRTLNKKIREWLEEKDGDATRIEVVLRAAYENARTPEGTQDRKMLVEQYYGKAKQQVELGGPDGGAIPLGGVMIVPAPPAGSAADAWQKQIEAEQDALKKGSED